MSDSQANRDSSKSDSAASIDASARDEIDKILDEVEQLRNELGGTAKKTLLPSEEGGDSMEETLSTLAETPSESEEAIIFDEAPKAPLQENVVKFPQAAQPLHNTQSNSADEQSAQAGSLKMTLSGSMTLKLSYEYEGQEVSIGFADQYLQISLADGTEFKIPVGSRTAQARKKVA
jgi:hypothetical protein